MYCIRLPLFILLYAWRSLALGQSHYDDQQQLLIVEGAKAFGGYWSAEFKDMGQQHFELRQIKPYAGIDLNSGMEFNADSGVLTLPAVSALGKSWRATLQQQSSTVFKLLEISPNEKASNPAERYIIHNDGTVTDKETGLQWMRCSLGQTWNGNGCSGNHLKLSMQDAAYAAFNSRFLGKADWRLPTIDELKSLIYCNTGKPQYWNTTGYRCNGNYQTPTIYEEAFPDSRAVYWSISSLQADPGEDNTLTVSFNYGHVYYSYFKGDYESARFVRGKSTIVPGPEVVGGFKETPCVTAICSTVPR